MWVHTLHKKIKFSIKDLFSKYDQIRRKLRILPHLQKNFVLENLSFCAVTGPRQLISLFRSLGNRHEFLKSQNLLLKDNSRTFSRETTEASSESCLALTRFILKKKVFRKMVNCRLAIFEIWYINSKTSFFERVYFLFFLITRKSFHIPFWKILCEKVI